MWDAGTGSLEVGLFEGNGSGVNSLAFSPDGARVVSGFNDGTIHSWDAETGYMVAEPFERHTGWVVSVAFSPDGARVVSGSRVLSGSLDKVIRIWDAETGAMVAGPFEGHTNWVGSVAFSPDGARIVSGSLDKAIRIWNIYPEPSNLRNSRMLIGSSKFHLLYPSSITLLTCTSALPRLAPQ